VRFEPKTEEQISNLLPDGEYKFKVIKAEDKQAQSSGADMIKLTLKIDDKIVFDNLLESMAYKLIHFCNAADLLHKYDAGTLTASDCDGKEGFCKIITDAKDPAYAPKNVIKDYCKKDLTRKGLGAPRNVELPNHAPEFNDNIPF